MPARTEAPTGRAESATHTAAEFGPPSLDVRLAELAAAQYGVVSRRQVCDLGLRDAGITARLGAGRRHRVHHGVYAVGHSVLGQKGHWMAAVLACGPGVAAQAFENDRARDVIALSAGYGTLRFTDRQLTRRPQHVATAIAAVLADRRAP